MTESTIAIGDEAAMEALGARVARFLPSIHLIYLRGPLGAGKTTLVRGLLRALGHIGPVKSPTFTLVEPYDTAIGALYHFDLYRLVDPEELEFIGLRDYLSSNGVCIIEWPERASSVLPRPDLDIMIETNSKGRSVVLQGHTQAAERAVRECR